MAPPKEECTIGNCPVTGYDCRMRLSAYRHRRQHVAGRERSAPSDPCRLRRHSCWSRSATGNAQPPQSLTVVERGTRAVLGRPDDGW